jgi:uncharacterized protein YkwD
MNSLLLVRARRRVLSAVAAIALIAGAGTIAAPAAAGADAVVFADPDLLAAVNLQLGREDLAQPVSVADAAAMTELYASYAEIDSLGGLEHFTSLTDLSLDGNRIADITVLANLTKLATLSASWNAIVDVRPLAKLTRLQYAWLSGQQVTLAALATSATQQNPLRTREGTVAAPYSDTAAVAADGKSWRLRTAGTHTLSWSVYEPLPVEGGYYVFDGTITQQATGPSQLAKTPSPTFTGVLRVGSTLTAAPGKWDSGVGFTYLWLAGGVAIPGATGKTLTLKSAQKNTSISLRVTGSKKGYESVTTSSAASAKVIVAPVPAVKGAAKLGKKLTVTKGTWTAGTKTTVQWYADKVAVPGATKSTFTVTSSEQGKVVFARVTGVKAGYAKVAMDSKGTAKMTLLSTSSRSSVAAAYKKILVPALKVTTGWTGSVKGCKIGTEKAASKTATLTAVNFMRAMNQLDGVRLNDSWTKPAMRNSLMMQAREEITHWPAKTGRCWSASGATAAARSNLFLSWGGSATRSSATGARAVAGYMVDPGEHNYMAGHRRWIMLPELSTIGTGSTGQANTLTVMGANGPVTSSHNARPTWLEWPSAGWFPRQLEPDGLWSLSASSPDVDFGSAKVSVKTAAGKKLKVGTYPVLDGYGPNTITWQVKGLTLPKGAKTSTYVVKVSGIRGAATSSYSYTVKLFDPYG